MVGSVSDEMKVKVLLLAGIVIQVELVVDYSEGQVSVEKGRTTVSHDEYRCRFTRRYCERAPGF
jgi:hypothetical protein